MEQIKLNQMFVKIAQRVNETMTKAFDDLKQEEIYKQHSQLLYQCGMARMAKEFKAFLVDDYNRDALRLLLYYFNNCQNFETMIPKKNYKIHKHIMLCGPVGSGKTLIMQVFADYLALTNNPNRFYNLSVTQMINYYKLHNHLDKYTYNETKTNNFEGEPYNICLNDVGMQTHLHFGTDTKTIVTDFFHARNEIWSQQGGAAHITTNLTPQDIKKYFADEFDRTNDRFKTYNVIKLEGDSRR